jgi:hypothetical protein
MSSLPIGLAGALQEAFMTNAQIDERLQTKSKVFESISKLFSFYLLTLLLLQSTRNKQHVSVLAKLVIFILV